MAKPLTPKSLTVILSLVLVVMLGIGAAGVVYFRQVLRQQADDTAAISAQAASSNQELQSLINAKTILDDNADVVTKAANIAADSTSHVYQNQINDDINSIAARAAVQITLIDFGGSTTGSVTTTSNGAAIPTATLPGGVKATTVNVTIKSPVPYANLMAFMHYIEENSYKMQISKVSITNANSKGDSMVNSDVFTITAYVR